jgi:CheY-like chemotaxis protein
VTVATKCPPAVVLLVEDDLEDQILTQEAFKGLKVPYELRIVPDGKEALDYLYQQGTYQEAPQPDLILLDLNMPRVNGQQVAERIHADPQLRQIPIVVLTTSRRQEDVLQAYGRGVTSFISKPLDFQHFISTVQELEFLIKFALEMKSLRDRTRVTDRQIRRLARRREQLLQRADSLFNQHMKQIEAIFLERRAELNRDSAVSSPSVSSAEAATREALIELAHKILQGRPAKVRPEASRHSPQPQREGEAAAGRHWNDPYETASGLSELARHLEAAAGNPQPAKPGAPVRQPAAGRKVTPR